MTALIINSSDEYVLPDSGDVTLKFWGIDVTPDQFKPYWTPLGSGAIDGGYEVVWQNANNTNAYGIWTTDANGSVLSYQFESGSDYSFQLLETVLNQDLNGDGVTGPVGTVIQVNGSTTLAQEANEYVLSHGSGTGTTLKYNGSDVVVDQFGADWTPIGAIQTASGYEVAWKFANSDLFSIWDTDGNGNVISYTRYLGEGAALRALEVTFGQDLNGDGHIGLHATNSVTTNSHSAPGVTEIDNLYYLNSGNDLGPTIKIQGENLVDGQYGSSWVPLAAVPTAGGYEVAWKYLGSNLYAIWNTDSNGNVISYTDYSGSDYGLQAAETTLRQDLNGDGVIGPVQTMIEVDGPTSLIQKANEYFLSNSDGTGTTLKYNGSDVTVGQLGSNWAPIGAEETSNGYVVVWKNSDSGIFDVWNTDRNGNKISEVQYLGQQYPFETLETQLHQDLNRDGQIGPVTTVIASNGSTTLTQEADEYFLNSETGAGPALAWSGFPVFAAEFGLWTPVAAAMTASGYEVAWRYGNSDLFSIWTTDNSGNCISYTHYNGSEPAFREIEVSFHKDLNDDGLLLG
jgi:hypothetical protein